MRHAIHAVGEEEGQEHHQGQARVDKKEDVQQFNLQQQIQAARAVGYGCWPLRSASSEKCIASPARLIHGCER